MADRETGEPLRRIKVELVLTGSEPRRFETATDAEGKYQLTGLPAGAYYATAMPAQHRTGYQPASFSPDPKARPTFTLVPPLALKIGEIRSGVDFLLARTFAVEGRVVNEFGEPLADVQVSVERVDIAGGYQMFSTDDRGIFRVYGLPPGEYRVCASISDAPWERPTTGDTVRVRFVRTCYPSAATDTAAAGAVIKAADVTGLIIQMQRARAYTLSGVVVSESGAPVENASINIEYTDRSPSRGSVSAEVNRGTFVARGVPPGSYVIRASINEPPDRSSIEARTPGLREFGVLPATIEAGNVTDLVVTTSRGADVRGRLIVEGGTLPAAGSRRMGVMLQRGSDIPQWMYPDMFVPPTPVKDDFTFELTRLYGPYIVGITGVPPGWVVKSVRYGEADITELPVEFKRGDAAPLEVTITNRGARLTVRPVDQNNQPVLSAVPILVPVERARWNINALYPFGATVKSGSIELGPRRPGEYFIGAVVAEDVARLARNTDMVKAFTERALRITLREDEQRSIDIPVIELPGER